MKPTRYRYRILALLFIATTINYMDRSVIGVLAPTLQYKVFQWSDVDYANINIAFKLAYAIGMLTMGAIVDKLGAKWGYTLSILIWSVFGMLHAAIRPAFGVLGFMLARFGLGFGEAGNFPSAIKTVAEWFPKKERAFATGIFNAGTNVGALLAPLMVPLVVAANGDNWQYAFLITGAFSAIWVVLWLLSYHNPEQHPKVNEQELAYINSDTRETETLEKLPWRKVLPLKETWAFGICKLTDAAWWFYLFWTGKFLFDQFGLDIKKLALPLILIYLVADVGSVLGGWVSGYLINKGWSVNRARKTTLFCCALFILPVMFATQIKTTFNLDDAFFAKITQTTYTETTDQGKMKKNIPQDVVNQLSTLKGDSYKSAKEFIAVVRPVVGPENMELMESAIVNSARSNNWYWIAVLLISLAAGAHQAWSANVFTLVSDVFPKRAVASVVGIGGMMGALAGLLADFTLGQVLKASGPEGYFFAFLIAGSMYLFTLLFMHLLMPKMTPVADKL